jgi:hypothetical protein
VPMSLEQVLNNADYATTYAQGVDALREMEAAVQSSFTTNPGDAIGDRFQSELTQLVAMYNHTGMVLLSQTEYVLSKRLIGKAITLTERPGYVLDGPSRQRLHAVSLNNLACVCRKREKPHAALRLLEKALGIEEELPAGVVEDPATTYLNL